jgi:hypothetical protein
MKAISPANSLQGEPQRLNSAPRQGDCMKKKFNKNNDLNESCRWTA